VLINTKPEFEHEVYNSLKNQSKILEIKPLYREFDMIAKIRIEKKEDIGFYISNKIRSLDGVIHTKTIQ